MYVCDVCGFQIEGPVPEEYICPVCGVDASHFILVEENK